MKKQILIGTMTAAMIAIGTLYYASLRAKPQKQTAPLETVTVGVETSILPSAVWVAENRGYFKDEGLDVNIKEFDSGRTALKTMLEEGILDMVTVAQTPVMFNSFARNDYAIIASMVYSENDLKLLARKDKGILTPSDLKGKKIGMTRGSTGHFFLSVFLIHKGLLLSDIETVDLDASELPPALADGRVDAISTWEPHILNASKLLGDKAAVLSYSSVAGGSICREDFYFVSNKTYVRKNQDTLKRFLRAVDKGEAFIKKNKEEAINIVAERLGIDKGLIVSIWDDFEFQLALDQTSIRTLEDEARWAIESNLTKAGEVPNYLDYIYMDALEEVKPESVTIYR